MRNDPVSCIWLILMDALPGKTPDDGLRRGNSEEGSCEFHFRFLWD